MIGVVIALGILALGCVVLFFLYRKWDREYDLKRFWPTLFYWAKPFFISLAVMIPLFILLPYQRLFTGQFDRLHWYHAVLLAVFVVSLVVFIRSTVLFAKPIYYMKRVIDYELEVTERGYVISNEGKPGTGKTLLMTYDAVLMAPHQYGELLKECYYLVARQLHGKITPEESRALTVITETLEFYHEHPEGVPLLVSNYPIEVGGRMSMELHLEHLLQIARLPERAVLCYDEFADDVGNRRSVNTGNGKEEENALLADTLSKLRHYGEMRLEIAEQDHGENFIGARRVASVRETKGVTKLCAPYRLIKRLRKKERKLYKVQGDCSALLLDKIIALREKVRKIGFLRVEIEQDGKKGAVHLPADPGFRYNSRAYRFNYGALDKPLELQGYDSLYLPTKERSRAQLIDEELELELELRFYARKEREAKRTKYRCNKPIWYREYESKRKTGRDHIA